MKNRGTEPLLLLPLASVDSLCKFQAFGSITLKTNGRHFKTAIDLKWHGDSQFRVNIYSPFGGLLASINPDCSGVWMIAAGDTVFKIHPSDELRRWELLNYPITYAQLMRILTGRLLDYAFINERPDSLYVNGKNVFLYWYGDVLKKKPYDIITVINRKQSSVKDVIYCYGGTGAWELVFSSFKNSVPKEIRFKDSNNNYFYLTFDTAVSVFGSNACHEERH